MFREDYLDVVLTALLLPFWIATAPLMLLLAKLAGALFGGDIQYE